jgi:hypothetical protein
MSVDSRMPSRIGTITLQCILILQVGWDTIALAIFRLPHAKRTGYQCAHSYPILEGNSRDF